MPSVNVNPGTIKVTRGIATKLGTVTALAQVAQFTLPEPTRDAQGFMIIQTNGTIGANNSMQVEASCDQGQTWFVLNTSTNLVFGLTGQIGGDPAASSADAFQVNGMGSGVLFRCGITGTGAAPSCSIWCCFG